MSCSDRAASPRCLRLVVVLVLAVVNLVAVTAAYAATRVRYFDGTAVAGVGYTNGVLGYKTYNEMYAGTAGNCGLPVGIYELTSGGSTIRALNGCGYVYLTHPSEYARAYCWNRSASGNFLAQCDYIHP